MGLLDSTTARTKAAARSTLDRAVAPYLERLLTASQGVAAAADDPVEEPDGNTSAFFHGTLHELRTLELERLPAGGRLLSVGASGRWYFDWFERHVGDFDEHIGVEAFEPEPSDLPAYATWIDSTADRFDGVADGSIDMVFAGQTTEHLWPEEMVGFLLESHRVLRTGGLLVADSPNRLITEFLTWTHGGHTVELSASEIGELVELAGFDVDSVRGAWLCRDTDGNVLELEDGIDDPVVLTRRVALGGDRPDDSFVWWLTATRTDRAPDPDALRAKVDELYSAHWSTRVCRGMWPGPGSPGPSIAPGHSGLVSASLPMFLRSGRYRLAVRLDEGTWDDLDGLRIDITSPGGHLVDALSTADATVIDGATVWEWDRPDLVFALSIELHVGAVRSAVRVAMPLEIEQVG